MARLHRQVHFISAPTARSARSVSCRCPHLRSLECNVQLACGKFSSRCDLSRSDRGAKRAGRGDALSGFVYRKTFAALDSARFASKRRDRVCIASDARRRRTPCLRQWPFAETRDDPERAELSLSKTVAINSLGAFARNQRAVSAV